MSDWLQNFANRIELTDNIWVFLLSLAMAVVFALITVCFQTIKTALANPVDSLKSE
jgi:putative ABC transport system permease protein